MPRLSRLYCNLVDHRVNRHRVWHDKMNYRTHCARCGEPLIRDPAGWREYSATVDADPRRLPDSAPHA